MQLSTDIILLDRTLARYGPQAQNARALLKRSVAETIERLWPASGAVKMGINSKVFGIETLYGEVEALAPNNGAQREMCRNALAMALAVARAHAARG